MKGNIIPRRFTRITAEQLTNTSGGKADDVWHIFKNDSGYLGLNKRTGIYYYIFPAHLRMPEQFKFIEIEKGDDNV